MSDSRADRMLRSTRAIAAIAFRLSLHEIARVLSVPVSRVVAGFVVAGASAVALGGLLAVVASSGLPEEVPAELRAAVVGTSFGSAALSAAAIVVALSAVAPPRTALQNLLALLPIGPATASLGQLAPTLLLALGYTLAMSSTASVVIVRTAADAGAATLGLVAEVALVVAALLLAAALFSLTATAAERGLRLPTAYATSLAGLVTLGVTFATIAPDVLLPPPPPGVDPGLAGLLPHRVFAAVATTPSVPAGLAAVAWLAAAVGLTVLAARLHRPATAPRRVVVPRGTRPLRAAPAAGLLWLELLVAVRTPQVVLVALLVPLAVAGVVLVSTLPIAEPFVPSLGAAVVLLPALIGLQVPGRTLPFDWASDLATARPAVRLLPQFAAVGLIAAVIATPALVVLLAFGVLDPSMIGVLVLRGVLACALALACGSVVPWSEQQPLSATAGGLLLALASVSLGLGLSAASSTLGPASEVPLLALAAVLAAGLFASARLRSTGRLGAA